MDLAGVWLQSWKITRSSCPYLRASAVWPSVLGKFLLRSTVCYMKMLRLYLSETLTFSAKFVHAGMLHLEKFPNDEFRWTVLALVVMSIVGTFIWDRVCLAIFA